MLERRRVVHGDILIQSVHIRVCSSLRLVISRMAWLTRVYSFHSDRTITRSEWNYSVSILIRSYVLRMGTTGE